MAYNLDGTVASRTDQREVVIAYSYDNLRRPQSQKVTSLGDGGQNVDGSVRSITRKYDSLGRVVKITSHSNQTDDPDNTSGVVNQIVYTYNDLGQVTESEQEHSGTVDGSTLGVQYGYDLSATSSVYDDGARQESVTYPDGRVVYYTFGSAGGINDLEILSRVVAWDFLIRRLPATLRL